MADACPRCGGAMPAKPVKDRLKRVADTCSVLCSAVLWEEHKAFNG